MREDARGVTHGKRERRFLPPELQADAGKLVQAGRSMVDVVRDLDMSESPSGAWVNQAEAGTGNGQLELGAQMNAKS